MSAFDSLCQMLDNLPDQLERRMRSRQEALDSAHAGDFRLLKSMIVESKSYQKDIDRLMASLKNAAPLLAKFNKQAEKDEALMLELARKANRPSFGTDHPICRDQDDALKEAEQKLGFSIKELVVLKALIDRNNQQFQRGDPRATVRVRNLIKELEDDVKKMANSLSSIR